MSLSARSSGGRARRGLEVEPVVDRVDARDGRGAVLEREPGARARRRVAEPADVGGELARGHRRRLGGGEQVAAADVEVVVERDRHRRRRGRGVQRAVERLDRATRVRAPEGSATTSSPGRSSPPATRPAYGAARRRRGRAARAGPGSADRRARSRAARVSRCASSGGPAYQAQARRALDDVVAVSALTGCAQTAPSPICARCTRASRAIASKASSDQSTRSILLTRRRRGAGRAARRSPGGGGVCSITPWRASTSTIATSAVEAPVTMLRVYCAWPGRVGQHEAPARRWRSSGARRRS